MAQGATPSPLQVLHVYRTYFPDPPGGLQEAIRQICLATRPLGTSHRVFTLSPHPEPAVIHREEAEVHRHQQHFEIASSGFSLKTTAAFAALAARADVVHYHFPWPFADLLHLVTGVRKPTLVTYHSDIVRQRALLPLYRPLMHHFLASADCLVATSPAYAATSRVLRRYRHKVEVIPLALDEAACRTPSEQDRARIRRQHGTDFFLFIGVLRYYKGLSYLLEALRTTSMRAVIAGIGPEEARLRAIARRDGLTNVAFAGFISDADKQALIENCRAIVFPSTARSEAFGVTLLEGAMQSRALICTEIGTGTTFVNRHGETGLVVPPADPIALRQAMYRLHAEPALAAELGCGARARFEALFRSAAMGQRYAELYRRLAGGAAAAAG